MVFIVLHNDGQYTNSSPKVIGAFDHYDASCIFGWKTVIKAAKQPWTAKHYKKRKGEFAHCYGLGLYYIEEWNTTTNEHIKTLSLGKDKSTYILDAYLKENCHQYDTIIQNWSQDLESNIFPSKLQELTFAS